MGDYVYVKRAGDVIPEIIGPVTEKRQGNEKEITVPDKCPVCNGNIFREDGEINYRCLASLSCPAQIIGKIKHFVSKNCMNISGMGDKIVEFFVKENLINDIADIYYLKYENIINLKGFSYKSTKNLIESINNSKSNTLWRLINGLGIRYVGEEISRLLAKYFIELDNLINANITTIENAIYKKDIKTKRKSLKIAENIVKFFKEQHNLEVINKLKNAGVNFTEFELVNKSQTKPFEGLKFVITGTLTNYKRDEAKKIISQLGGKVLSSVSKNVDYLICGEAPGSKLEKAKKLGINILYENDFSKMIQTN